MHALQHIYKCCLLVAIACLVRLSGAAQPNLTPEINAVELHSELNQETIEHVQLIPKWGVALHTKKGVFVSTINSQELLKGSDSLVSLGQVFVAGTTNKIALVGENGAVNIYTKKGRETFSKTVQLQENILGVSADSNAIWLATTSNKLMQINWETLASSSLQLSFECNGLIAVDGSSLLLASNTELWFGLKNTLAFEQVILAEVLTEKPIYTSLTAAGNGDFFAGTYERGIFKVRGKSGYSLKNTENYFNIKALTATTNHLYFIDENAQLIRYDGFTKTCSTLSTQFKKFPAALGLAAIQHEKVLVATRFGLWQIEGEILQLGIPLNQPTAAAFLHSNTIAFADKNGVTLQALDHSYQLVLPQFKGGIVTSLFAQKNSDTLWIGTFDYGLFAVNSKGETLAHFTTENGLPNASILSINGADNALWLATLGGLCRYNLLSKNFTQLPQDADAQYVYSVFKDSKNRVWLGTDGSGLLEVTTEGKTEHIQKLRSTTVYSIAEDKHGHVWFSSSKKGLFEYELDRPIFYPINQENGLRSLAIASICGTAAGNMLVFSDRGVDFTLVDERKAIAIKSDMALATPSEIIRNSFVDNAKNVWFYTDESFYRIEKTVDAEFENAPQLAASFYVNGYLKQHQALQNLHYDENTLVVKTGFEWAQKNNQLQVMYRVLESDTNWIAAESDEIIFNTLTFGNHTLQLAYGRSGYVFENSIQTFPILIEKPWWQRAYFIVAEIIAVLLLLFAIISWRAKSLANTERLYRSKAEAELQAIKNQVNPHFLFNSFNSLLELIETSPPQATTYLEQLSDFYRGILQTTTSNLIALSHELQLLDNYIFLQQERFGHGFKVEKKIDAEFYAYQLPPLAIQRLFENALKHNAILISNPLVIELYIENDWLVVKNNKIAKTGKQPTSTGIGLKSINDQLELTQQKSLQVQDSSTYFIVRIPLAPPA